MARTTATNRTTSIARVADGYRLNRQEHSPSASFNGSSTGITLGFKANSTGFTIATWIKVRRFTAGDRIFDQQDSGPSKGFAVLMPVTASDRSLYFSVFGDSSEEANIKIALNIWEWTHIAISFEPNSAKFYKNGVLAGTDTSVSLGDSVTNLVIGKNASSAANYFNGLMKDFVVYDRVLSLAEVENVRDGIVSQTNLKCHLPLSSDLADISVNGNDGTATVVFTYTNDSPFNDTVGLNMYAPLKSSLLLERGIGYPTWSRATKAWGFNELGYLEELASGCAFFGGARLVRNLVPTPSNTLAIAGTKTVTLTQAATLQFSMGAGAGTATFSGTGGASGTLAAGASRVSVNKTVTAGTFIVTASVADLVDLSIVDVTNYDASYIPEYVSVGVVATPFFGAGIDGAKYFSTDYTKSQALPNLSGLRIEAAATNNILHSRNLDAPDTGNNIPVAWVAQTTGSSLVTNGTFDSDVSGWTGGAAWEAGTARIVGLKTVYQNLSLTVGKTYQVTANISVVAGSSYSISIKRDGNFVKWQTVTTPSFLYSVTSEGAYQISFYVNTGVTIDIDNVVVKECTIFVSPAIGLDGIDNTATTLTATATDATILQSTTIASAARCASAYVKRRTGTGTISFTQDGGSSWTDITSLINSSTWSRVQITATLANPSVGFKISTSGDAIDVDCVQNEAGAVATSPIVTTTTAVTRNADSLTYQTASNWSDTEGTLYFEAAPYEWKDAKAVAQAYLYNIKSGIYTWDGTASAYGPEGIPSGREKLAMRWSTVTGKQNAASSGGVGAVEATYDGSWGMASIVIFSAAVGYCGHVAIYNYAMTDAELQAITK